jgi:hypothetical protein
MWDRDRELTEDRVSAGAVLLDEQRPGWYAQIDLQRLDMDSYDDCVLGQLFGSFEGGLETLDAVGLYIYNIGFAGVPGDPREVYELLGELWTREINLRATR